MNNKQKNKMILTLIACFFLSLLVILVMISNYLKVEKEEYKQAVLSGQSETLQDVVEKHENVYIKDQKSKEKGFFIDIYVVFKHDLYDGENSNETFYNKTIEDIAKFLQYRSFRLIDENKKEKIEIKVICRDNEISTIIINDIEDYFIYMDSQINFTKFENVESKNFDITSKELNMCIEKNWNYDLYFGSRESIFQNYYIYFDEGMQVRTIDKKIYNIVFTDKYKEEVLKGIRVGSNFEMIKDFLGEPTFKSGDDKIWGYKSNKMYIFFEENQISVYRNDEDIDYKEFLELLDLYVEDEYSFKDFMNELTYIWPDYSEYKYDSNFVFISYPNKGIDVKVNYEDTNGIVFYNNVGIDKDVILRYLQNTDFSSNLQVDDVFQAEKRRCKNIFNFEEECKGFVERNEGKDDRNHSQIYDYYAKADASDRIISMYFVSKNSENFNCELNERIDSYVWYNDTTFIYGKIKGGIYYYDLKNQKRGAIVEGNDKGFTIESCENGILKYDNNVEIQLNF